MTPIQAETQSFEATSCEKEGCCSTADDGSAICVPSAQINVAVDSILVVKSSSEKRTFGDYVAECKTVWKKIRGGLMFSVACIASPCCTPIIVPIALTLLAGTPVALWMGQNLGWVYGGLTLLSVVSFVLGLRWMGQNGTRRNTSSKPQPSLTGNAKTEIRSQSL